MLIALILFNQTQGAMGTNVSVEVHPQDFVGTIDQGFALRVGGYLEWHLCKAVHKRLMDLCWPERPACSREPLTSASGSRPGASERLDSPHASGSRLGAPELLDLPQVSGSRLGASSRLAASERLDSPHASGSTGGSRLSVPEVFQAPGDLHGAVGFTTGFRHQAKCARVVGLAAGFRLEARCAPTVDSRLGVPELLDLPQASGSRLGARSARAVGFAACLRLRTRCSRAVGLAMS